jgi:hypothetical protein
MKIGLLCDVLVTLAVGGGTTVWAVRSPESDLRFVAVAAWLFLAAAWIFVLLVSRGLWAPSAIDTAAFVDLSIKRCRKALMTVWFAVALFLAEIVFGMTWAYQHSVSSETPLLSWLLFSSLRVDIVWAMTLTFFVGAIVYSRKKKTELARLLALKVEFGLSDTKKKGST